MIFNLLFKAIVVFVTTIFMIFPTLPAMPDVIVTTFNSFLQILSNGVGLLKWLLSPALFNITITSIIALINFDYIYRFVMFVVRKLPIGVK